VKVLDGPIAAIQAKWLKATIRMAPPAAGPTSGIVDASLPGQPLAIAVVGDSTAAGCGVANHDESFTGWLARETAARARRSVRWQVVGQFGATARRIRYRLLPQLGQDLDAAVFLGGGNDVMSGCNPEQWREDLAAIIDDLQQRADQVVVAGVPPFALFPSIPAALGRVLTARAKALDEVSRQLCAARPGTTWVTITETAPSHFFASDRFHLSAAGYRRWAEVIADNLAL
jgi:lysophospholipase L1-like esterase